jgi:RNA polymerase sigma factor (sigma-70 family)
MTDDERSLWSDYLRTGCPSLREQIAREYMESAVSFAVSLSQEWMDCDQVESDAMFALAKAIDSFDLSKSCSFRTFLFHVVRSTLRQTARWHATRPPIRFVGEAVGNWAPFGVTPHQQPIDVAIDRELQGIISSRCTPNHADVLLRMYWGGLSKADVARERGVSRENIRQLHNRAIDRLREVIT